MDAGHWPREEEVRCVIATYPYRVAADFDDSVEVLAEITDYLEACGQGVHFRKGFLRSPRGQKFLFALADMEARRKDLMSNGYLSPEEIEEACHRIQEQDVICSYSTYWHRIYKKTARAMIRANLKEPK